MNAIAEKERNEELLTLCKDENKDACQKLCDKALTPCEWVGNGTYHACLQKGGSVPQRVYNGMNGGKLRLGSLTPDI